jgi:integrase/DNA-directed RNA polymerase subunit M/transcription elongation factor TFIIS
LTKESNNKEQAASSSKRILCNIRQPYQEAINKRIVSKIEKTSSVPQINNISITCPICGSSRVIHNGFRNLENTKKTGIRKCNDCGSKFSENYIRFAGQRNNRKLQICAKEMTKNLDTLAETKTVTGDEKDIKGMLLEYHVKMQLQGYKQSTIRLSESALRTLLARGANLTKPDTVKEIIAKQSTTEKAVNGKIWSGNRKRNVINAYTAFLKHIGLTWEPPLYEIVRKLPFIPTEAEIDSIISASPNALATFLQLLKETGMRRGEAISAPWKDVDFERRVIMCNCPEKGSNPRIFSDLSGKLLNMLNNLPKENEYLFGINTIDKFKNQLCRTRNKLSFKLGNPRLKEIHMHTFRYWKGTMLYHYKPDILYVAEFLGHKDIENTRLYIQIEKNLFKNLPNDQFITRIAINTEQACNLIEVGFEYITGEYNDGGKIFRKRK